MISLSLSSALWLVWLALGLAHEAYALASPGDNWIPLTTVVRELVAQSFWLRVALQLVLWWAVWHFGVADLVAEIRRKLP